MTATTCCCPKLKRDDWDKEVFYWKNKPFYETGYWSLFRMPLTYGKAVKEAMEFLKSRNLAKDPMLVLSGEESMFHSSLLIEMSKDDRSLPVRRLTGKFISLFFEGEYRDTPTWVRQTVDYCMSQGEKAKELYFFYATCPKCAKHYGSTQTVIIARMR